MKRFCNCQWNKAALWAPFAVGTVLVALGIARYFRDTPPLAVGPFSARRAKAHQAAWAAHLRVPVELTNSLGMRLVLIPPGRFVMGAHESEVGPVEVEGLLFHSESDEIPQRRVWITEPFFLGMHQVNVGAFRQFVDATGDQTEAERDGKGGSGWEGAFVQHPKYNWRNPSFPQTDDHPVVNVSWSDAVAFCEWLSAKEHRTYRLPTEAEWEYACRAGTTTAYYHGNDPEGLAAVGNIADATASETFPSWNIRALWKDGYVFTAPVGCFQPNAFGLYDMHGNVWEWCSDWYGKDYYASAPAADPVGPSSGSDRVIRGGSWSFTHFSSRSAARFFAPPNHRTTCLGFRVVLVVGTWGSGSEKGETGSEKGPVKTGGE